jgi:hypothetical protein
MKLAFGTLQKEIRFLFPGKTKSTGEGYGERKTSDVVHKTCGMVEF